MSDPHYYTTKKRRLYDSVRWRKARNAFLANNPLCVMCESRGLTVAGTVVDHKIPHKGSYELFWSVDNWQSLCSSCHSAVKAMQERHGYSQGCDLNGNPIDSSHPWLKEK